VNDALCAVFLRNYINNLKLMDWTASILLAMSAKARKKHNQKERSELNNS